MVGGLVVVGVVDVGGGLTVVGVIDEGGGLVVESTGTLSTFMTMSPLQHSTKDKV